jgi:SOS-response transcriptional repressor LexA
MKELTDRQQRVLDFIRTHLAATGRPPTFREIGDHMGIRSTNGVKDHLVAIERKGFIRRRNMLARGIEVVCTDFGDDPRVTAALNWKTEAESLRVLLDRVAKASERLPQITSEMAVLLGDVRHVLGKDGAR